MIDELLKRYNLKYEELTPEERETFHSWLNAINQSAISIEKIREYVASMKASVENELTKVGHNNKQDLLLKARLRNYLLLEAFLSTPDKAKAQLEQALAGFRK